MFLFISADCDRSGPVVSLLIMPHCQDQKRKPHIWPDSKKTLTLRDTEIEEKDQWPHELLIRIDSDLECVCVCVCTVYVCVCVCM